MGSQNISLQKNIDNKASHEIVVKDFVKDDGGRTGKKIRYKAKLSLYPKKDEKRFIKFNGSLDGIKMPAQHLLQLFVVDESPTIKKIDAMDTIKMNEEAIMHEMFKTAQESDDLQLVYALEPFIYKMLLDQDFAYISDLTEVCRKYNLDQQKVTTVLTFLLLQKDGYIKER